MLAMPFPKQHSCVCPLVLCTRNGVVVGIASVWGYLAHLEYSSRVSCAHGILIGCCQTIAHVLFLQSLAAGHLASFPSPIARLRDVFVVRSEPHWQLRRAQAAHYRYVCLSWLSRSRLAWCGWGV